MAVTDPASGAQKGLISSLLKKLEYDPKTVTLMHRNLGVSEKWQGKPVTHWLDSLTVANASQLITRLRRDADEAEDDDD